MLNKKSDWLVLQSITTAVTLFSLLCGQSEDCLHCAQAVMSSDLQSTCHHVVLIVEEPKQLAAATLGCRNCCGHAEGMMWHSTAHPMYMIFNAHELTSLSGGVQVLQKASEEDRLVTAALNTHGTRAVQKLIETLATREQVCTSPSVLSYPQRESIWPNHFSLHTRHLLDLL